MTKEQESFLGMVLKVRNFSTRHQTTLATIPALSGLFTELQNKLEVLLTNDRKAGTDLTGYTEVKADKRTALENSVLRVSNALVAYAAVNNNKVLQKQAYFPSSDWYKMSEESLITQAGIINGLSVSLAEDMSVYGATPQDRTDLGTYLNDFILEVSTPTLVIDERKDGTQNIIENISDIRLFLNEKLDAVMRVFESTNKDLYELYNSARAIDINGSISNPSAVVTVAANSITSVYTLPEYDGDYLITVRNNGSNAVHFSLSTEATAEGIEKVLLNAGETRSRLASNLSNNGTYIIVSNSNTTPNEVKIWVE